MALPFDAPRSVLNGRVREKRRFATQQFPMERLRTLARRLMEEIVEAAAKFGHEIPRSFLDLQFERTAKMGAYHPSSLIDFAEGRDVELEEIWGEPVRRAKAVGVPVPRLVLDLAGGGRVFLSMTDGDPQDVKIGMTAEIFFRRLHDASSFHNYYWKCRPLAHAN